MTNSQRLAAVRAKLLEFLQQQSVSASGDESDPTRPIQSESILICDGFYSGRQFHCGSYRATWFMEADELKIHDDRGTVVAVFSGEDFAPESGETPSTIPMPQKDTDDDRELPNAA